MLESVRVTARSVETYHGVAPEPQLEALRRAAAPLRGARVLHVNATPYGGGVSELLRSTVPLLNDLGLVVHWKVIQGDQAFFSTTKKLHNALQGAREPLGAADRGAYLESCRENASHFDEEYDFVFLHDPQPAAVLGFRGKGKGLWIWRCHIDTSTPQPEAWAFLREHLDPFDAAIFTLQGFVGPGLPIERVAIIPPAIDPFSPKNMPLDDDTARAVLGWTGVRGDRPLVTQVSRFDPWKDPVGVVRAFGEARRVVPGLQLALVGSMALDDPEGWDVYDEVREATEGDPDVHLLTNLTGVGSVEVNAFQRLSRVVVQKSLREGFGLVVSEALWKGTPVVAGRVGGIPLQIADGGGGVLVDGVAECAQALVALLNDEEEARELGQVGRERVRWQFLLPRLLLDELELMSALTEGQTRWVDPSRFEGRDPVCGMAVADAELDHAWAGRQFRFCSEACRSEFEEAPSRFVGL